MPGDKKDILKATVNVEILPKLPIEKSLLEQLEIMEEYTGKHQECRGLPKEIREIECMRVLYPRMFRTIGEQDLIAGRYDALPIGFGCVTSVGGVGHYCIFSRLADFEKKLDDGLKPRVRRLAAYWEKEDTKAQFVDRYMDGTIMNAFSNASYACPVAAGIRLSGMMLDYKKLVKKGIRGIREEILWRKDGESLFYDGCLTALELFAECCDSLAEDAKRQLAGAGEKRKKELNRMISSLQRIKSDPPETFHEAIQLVWVYALLAGVINYGRLDDVLGEYLVRDLDHGILTRQEAKDIVKSLWTLIENKRTTVNGRVLIGGRGRENPEAADVFGRIALEVCHECRYVEPQFTLRLYEDTPKDMFDKAMECLADGATYPTLYNDAAHVPGLMHCMRVSEKEAEQYSPFGCGEMNLVGMTAGTPNTILNLTKTLNIALNEGVDPYDGLYKAGDVHLKKLEEITSYEEFYEEQYGKLHDYYVELCVDAQIHSYELLSENVSFLFNSILMSDCLEKGKAVLDGGVRYLGGCCETYGNINCSDSLYAIKKLVFDDKSYTLREVNNALLADFKGYDKLRLDMLGCAKYGNDCDEVDEIAVEAYNRVAQGIRNTGIRKGLHYYGIVIINNEANTKWGLKTSASADGRKNLVYLNPSNNPQGGADKSGPTAMLNSLVKLPVKWHVGAVQNIKFQKSFFKANMELIKSLFRAYFKNGGCQLMVTVVDRGALEDAVVHPEKYPDLIVRVSGFSAVFVNLRKETQQELLSRTLYDAL